jgi:hypothetical protein
MRSDPSMIQHTSSSFSTGPIRDIGFPLIAVMATLAFPFFWIVWLYLIVGHAHFLMAYLYQYRGKKMNGVYIAVAGMTLAGCLGYYFFVGNLMPFLVASGTLFALHFAIDEFTLHNERVSWISAANSIGFTLVFGSLLLLVAYPGLSSLPYLVGGIVCVALAGRFFFSTPVSKTEYYLWFIAFLLFVLGVILKLPESVLGVILLLHFANWYIGYGNRLKDRPARARSYWIEVAATLGLCALLFGAYLFLHMRWLDVLFSPFAYYAWALAHIVLSFVSSMPKES